MKARVTPLLLGAMVVFVLCTAGFCDTVADDTCGNGFVDRRGGVVVGDFGTSQEAVKLEAFLNAIDNFDRAATELVDATEDACRNLGLALGVPASEMPMGDVETTCAAVAFQIDEDMTAFEAAGLTVVVQTVPAQCSASFNATADCYARCDVDVDVRAEPPRCSGGQIVFNGCNVGCRGECHLPSAEVACHGECRATCTGGCTGSCSGSCSGGCYGYCEGTCDAYDGEGNCAGTCSGVCRGECDAECSGECWGTCEGSCSGECVVTVDGGGCEGECWGDCDVDIEPVRCEGGEFEVNASAECEAACDAEVSFQTDCRPPQVFITFEGDVEGVEVRAQLYAQAMQDALPDLLAIIEQLYYVLEAAGQLVAATAEGLAAAVSLGVRALACAGLAIDFAVEVQVDVTIAVDASVDVSAATTVQTE